MADDQFTPRPGGYTAPTPQKPATIKATAEAREGLIRLIILGVVLLSLMGTFILAMKYRADYAREILLVIGSSIGYLAGRSQSQRNE
jgi:hypothetical protein